MKLLLLIPVVILSGLTTLSILSRRGSAPGLKDGKLARLSGKPNAVSSEEGTIEVFKVDPLAGSKDEIRAAILATNGIITSETDDYISAIYITSVMRFIDDVEFRRDGPKWHIRSASRQGHSDMGANRKRVTAIRTALQTGMAD